LINFHFIFALRRNRLNGKVDGKTAMLGNLWGNVAGFFGLGGELSYDFEMGKFEVNWFGFWPLSLCFFFKFRSFPKFDCAFSSFSASTEKPIFRELSEEKNWFMPPYFGFMPRYQTDPIQVPSLGSDFRVNGFIWNFLELFPWLNSPDF
jgi:hypothetical protein